MPDVPGAQAGMGSGLFLRVLAQSLQQARQQGRSIHQLPIWYDVDDVDGLEKLQAEMGDLPPDSLIHTRKYLEKWSQTK